MNNPRNITELEAGYRYAIPMYYIDNSGVQDAEVLSNINFARGNKDDVTAPRQDGVFIESLIEVCIQRLQSVNVGDLATRDTSLAITHLEDALLRLGKRSQDRQIRGVEATYKK